MLWFCAFIYAIVGLFTVGAMVGDMKTRWGDHYSELGTGVIAMCLFLGFFTWPFALGYGINSK